VVLALLTSIGVAGIPAASLVAIVIILQALDMMRTTVNVFGDTTAAVVIAASEGEKSIPGMPRDNRRGRVIFTSSYGA
jgi:Na+/H+-dicarboxylate symporter